MEKLLTEPIPQQVFRIADASQISSTRRACAELTNTLGFSDVQAGRLSILVTELATNILKHALEGDMLVRPVQRDGKHGIELVAIDKGPGITNLSASLLDGVSTSGTPGNGLGAMRRLSSEFDIFSSSGKGTAVYLTVWSTEEPPKSADYRMGIVCLPVPPETLCGDGWALRDQAGSVTVMVADGLGHGPSAHEASRPAIEVIEQSSYQSSKQALEDIHYASRGTRGAAVAVAIIRPSQRSLLYSGIGNIAGLISNKGNRRQLMSHNGIVGTNMRAVHELKYDWDDSATLIMHSDGLQTQWDLQSYPGLESCHPALIAAVLYRDFSRNRDDVTIVVFRPN